MSYDAELIKEELKKHIPKDYEVDLDEVMQTVELVNGMTVFIMLTDGYCFVGNHIVDVMPGWKQTGELIR